MFHCHCSLTTAVILPDIITHEIQNQISHKYGIIEHVMHHPTCSQCSAEGILFHTLGRKMEIPFIYLSETFRIEEIKFLTPIHFGNLHRTLGSVAFTPCRNIRRFCKNATLSIVFDLAFIVVVYGKIFLDKN